MSLKVNSDFIIFGKESKDSFTTNFFHAYEDENPAHHGEVYINFSIASLEIDGEEFAQELFEVVRHHYFKGFERPSYERFEETLNEVNKLALEWREKKQVKFFADLHVVIGIIQNGELFLTQCGLAEAYLIRKRHLTIVSEGLSDNDKDRDNLFINVASGTVEDNDTVIFTTTRLLRYVSKSEMCKIFMRDSSLAKSFEDLRHKVEMELEFKANVLALNVFDQNIQTAADFSEEEDNESDSKLVSKVKSLVSKVPSMRLRKKKHLQEEGEQKVTSVHTRPHRKKPIIDLKSLTDFSTFGKDKVLVILVAVICILLVGLYVVRAKSVQNQRLSELEDLLTQVQQDLDEASTRGTFDKETAAELIDQAEQKVFTVLDSGEFRNKALQYKDEIKEARDQLDNIERVEDPVVLADLTTITADVNALGVLPLDDLLYAYEYDTIYPIMLDQIQDPETIDENEQVIDGVYFGDQDSLLFLTESHKIVEYQEGFVKFMDTTDPAWKSAVAVEAYGQRVYLLDPSENRIWRYRRGRDQYDGASEYSTEGDVTNAVDIAIDGAVYVLMNDGEIVKYYGGEIEEDFYVVREPMVPLEAPTRMFTEFEFGQVYILEPSQNRVLVYNKDIRTGNLVYSHQYQFDESLGTLKDIYVEKDANKLFVLTESKLYQIDF